MSRHYNQNHSPLLKIVYSRAVIDGKSELIPLGLYADGSLAPVEDNGIAKIAVDEFSHRRYRQQLKCS